MKEYNDQIIRLINELEIHAKSAEDNYIKYKLQDSEGLACYFEGLACGHREAIKKVFMYGRHIE